MPYKSAMNLRELYNLIEMIPEAGLQYIVNRMVPPDELTKDERKLLTQWITKLQRADYPQIIKDILFLLNIENIRWIANPSEEESLKVVYENPNLIEFLDAPSENVQVAAVKNKTTSPGRLFKLIKNPVKAVWLELVREKPDSILTMDNADVDLQRAAIEMQIDLITRHREWDPAIKQMAFETDPKYFPVLDNPTEEECWVGLHYDSTYIRHIKNPTPEMKAFAIIVA